MRRALSFLLIAGMAAAPTPLLALPFSIDTTTRESVKIDPIDGVPNQLSAPSESLMFQETSDGRLFTTFVSQDETVDGTTGDNGQIFTNRCQTTTGRKHAYWVDKASGTPAICLSVSPSGVESDGDSTNPHIGGKSGEEGRYVVFENTATSFGDPSGTQQVLVHDRKWERTWLSKTKDCSTPNGPSSISDLSADGSYILFSSQADNVDNKLEPKCSAGGTYDHLFLRNGKEGSCDPQDFGACTTEILYDRYSLHSGKEFAGLLNGNSDAASLSSDASTYAFESLTTVPIFFIPDLEGHWDVFLYSRPEERVRLVSQKAVALTNPSTGEVSLKNAGGPANGDSRNPKIDESAKKVVFDSVATDLVLEQVSSGTPPSYGFKPTNGRRQIYLYNVVTESVVMVSVNPDGSAGNGDSSNPWISADGRFVAFESTATDLIKDKTTTSVRNIFVRDLALEATYLVTAGPGETGINADASITDVGPTGLTVAYETRADNAIAASATQPADTNGVQDVFLARNACPDDLDNDKTPDCLDLCPTDSEKSYPAQCGCNQKDIDTDDDGVADCVDECSADPNKFKEGQCGCGKEDTDSDEDGVADCVDTCPNDKTKTTDVGVCGCGFTDTDANRNGAPDCFDPYLTVTPTTPKAKILSRGTRSGKMTLEIKATTPLPNKGFSYQFIVRGPTTRTIKGKNSRILVRNLRPGSYSVRYKIIVSAKVGTRLSGSAPAR